MITGTLTELKVAALAVEHGIDVSLPYGGQLRYDQIWDWNGVLYKVQIKTASEFEYGFKIPGRSAGKYKNTEIDGFATVHAGELYFIPFSDASSSEMKFYMNPPADRNTMNQIKWAIDYKITSK